MKPSASEKVERIAAFNAAFDKTKAKVAALTTGELELTTNDFVEAATDLEKLFDEAKTLLDEKLIDEEKLTAITNMIDTVKRIVAFNALFNTIKTIFAALTADELNSLTIYELVKATRDLAELIGRAELLLDMKLIDEEKLTSLILMMGTLTDHAKLKDLKAS